MRVSCAAQSLALVLHHLLGIVPSDPITPSYGCVLIEADQCYGMKLSVVDLSVGVSICLDAKVEEAGAIATPARILFQQVERWVKDDSPATVMFHSDGCCFTLSSSTSDESISLESQLPKYFPSVPETEEDMGSCSVSSKALQEGLAQVAFAAKNNEEHTAFSCVWLHLKENGTVTLAAANEHSLAVSSLSSAGNLSGVFLLPASSVVSLLPLLPLNDSLTIRAWPRGNCLFLEAEQEHFRGVIILHPEFLFMPEGRTSIPFLEVIPTTYSSLLLLRTAKLKSMIRRQELLHCMLTEVDGQPLLRIERFRKRQPKGEPIMFPVSWWGKSCEDLWLQNWNLLDMLSVPGSSPFLVVAVSEATYPATVLLRWVREGTVCQHSSYLFLAQNPYLAQMEVKRSHPLSQIAQQVFDAVLNGERQINEDWLTRKIREQVLTRILLLLEQVGVPPQRDIDYIVPESIEDAFFWNGFIRKKQERDRRFDWLVTKTAISSFRSGGVLVDVGLGNRLHFDGREIKEVLEQAKEEAEQRNADHYDLVRVGLDSLNRIARAQLG